MKYKRQYVILVTGIGGNVGQGVLRNIREYDPDCYIVGTDVNDLPAGMVFCDKFYKIPYAMAPDFDAAMIKICQDQEIDLVIPTTDYETYYLGLIRGEIPTLLASCTDTCQMCLDKYNTHLRFKQYKIPFAESFLPSQYKGWWKETIIKPREGRGSRNIFINEDYKKFDDTYVVQEKLIGEEITTAFYVTKQSKLHGQITMKRKLEHGMTSYAVVSKDYDIELDGILHSIINNIPIYGPCNLQSIVTSEGIVPFEVNCRYSGTNSIRSQFGFTDVVYGLQEYLYLQPISQPEIIEGTALRIYMDVIFKGHSPAELISSEECLFGEIF